MKVIFLDFDGVICTGRQAIASGERGVISGLDPVALCFLDRICRDHDIKIVISSTWRQGDRRRNFYEIFGCAGFIHLAKAIHENWATCSIPEKTRGHEIEEWLADNYCDGYLILDDCTEFLEYQKPFFVETDSYNGMLYKHYRKALEILGIEE